MLTTMVGQRLKIEKKKKKKPLAETPESSPPKNKI